MTNKALALAAARARRLGMEMVFRAGSGHIGGSLSSADILTELYFEQMHIDPAEPHAPWRDRFVMSKGHCTPALYSVLSLRGYFPREELELFRSIAGHMSGHPDMRHVPGVDMSTGSLGQGISAAVGMALAGKIDSKDYRVYAILGDGELDEGQVWEAAMSADKYHLDNLCAVVDYNKMQIDGTTDDVMPLGDLAAKWAAFGWHVIEVDGHDYAALADAFEQAKTVKGKPTVVLAHTVKGKGVSFMEGVYTWHGKAPNDEQYAQAKSELEAHLKQLEEEGK